MISNTLISPVVMRTWVQEEDPFMFLRSFDFGFLEVCLWFTSHLIETKWKQITSVKYDYSSPPNIFILSDHLPCVDTSADSR